LELNQYQRQGSSFIEELDSIIDNSNPLDFFQYLIGQNNQVDNFVETLKTRKKIVYEQLN